LHKDVERLLLITGALWMVLKEQHGFTDEKLAQLITRIDLRDGRPDGHFARTWTETCPHCGRTLAKNRTCCMYCGRLVLNRNPFARRLSLQAPWVRRWKRAGRVRGHPPVPARPCHSNDVCASWSPRAQGRLGRVAADLAGGHLNFS
jgi:hypothetical protein